MAASFSISVLRYAGSWSIFSVEVFEVQVQVPQGLNFRTWDITSAIVLPGLPSTWLHGFWSSCRACKAFYIVSATDYREGSTEAKCDIPDMLDIKHDGML